MNQLWVERLPGVGVVVTKLSALRTRLNLRADDAIIASYPRSANTWSAVRCVPPERRTGDRDQASIHPDRVMPDLRKDDNTGIDGRVVLGHRIIMAHDPHDGVHEAVYIVRDPADALVGYYHFHLRYLDLEDEAADGPDAFVINRVDEWIRHISSYLDTDPRRVHVVTYEQMTAQPHEVLRRTLDFLDIQHSWDAVKQTAEHHEVARRRVVEAEDPINPQEFFFRKGQVGSGADELEAETVSKVQQAALSVYEAVRNR